MLRRISASSWWLARATDLPSTSTSPALGSSSPTMCLSSTLLPLPDDAVTGRHQRGLADGRTELVHGHGEEMAPLLGVALGPQVRDQLVTAERLAGGQREEGEQGQPARLDRPAREAPLLVLQGR